MEPAPKTNEYQNLLGVKLRPECKPDNLTAIYEPFI
jgi:hypothetical protein